MVEAIAVPTKCPKFRNSTDYDIMYIYMPPSPRKLLNQQICISMHGIVQILCAVS